MNKTFYVLKSTVLASLMSMVLAPFSSYAQEEVNDVKSIIYVAPSMESDWHQADAGLPDDVNIRTLASSDKEVFIGTAQHGIYKSSAPALGWQPISNGLPTNSEVDALLTHQGRLFAGFYTKGVYISDDGGASWHTSNSGLVDLSVRSFLGYGSTLFTGTHDGLYRSDDNGNSWVAIKKDILVNEIIQQNSDLYAATNKGILRSTDGGKEWNWIVENGGVWAIAATDTHVFSMPYGPEAHRMKSDGKELEMVTFSPIWNPFTSKFFTLDGKVMVGQDNKLLSSTDAAQSWQTTPVQLGLNRMFTLFLKTPFGIIAVSKPLEGGC